MVMPKIAITALVGEFDHFIDEANQMTLSGKHLDDRFTFVLFVDPKDVHKIKQRHNVKIYEYIAPKDTYYESYRFAKSLEFLKPNEHILNEYDYLIKTDTDVFLTSALNNHIFDNKIYFGKGGYSETNRCIEELYELSKMFKYKEYKRLFSPASTFLGPTEKIIRLMDLSNILCKDIFYYLCPNGDYGSTLNSTWGKTLYGGTSTLIATEIVLSSIFHKDELSMTNQIDANCFSNSRLGDTYHIHQWHGDAMYSKFAARDGKYDDLQPLSNNSISNYCLRIFLENKRETNA
jgi:hypothetical protein